MRPPGPEPSPNPPQLEALLAQCIEAIERGEVDPAPRVCTGHPELLERVRRRLAGLQRGGLVPATPPPLPAAIGPYRIVRELGSGGMGSVYLAEQSEPVQRQVAVKVIKLGMDTREVVARFQAERQALARMSHPHIAQVFDAGSTADGRPFFVMELVSGTALTTFCRRRDLPLAARVRLLATICRAVQHAHERGFIHRDLKPSNILVDEQGGQIVPKIIDFGIAKAAAGACRADDLRTRADQVLGTPEYMSPEQATSGGLEVDTRGDVWSLGVILYELLTGELPFDSLRLRKSSRREMEQILQHEMPTLPSRRRTTTTAGTTAGGTANGGILPLRIAKELDWITMKALAKQRADRYPTALALAEDIDRWSRQEPLHAAPPGRAYRVRKFVRRHRLEVGAAGAVLLALVAGLIASIAYRVRAEQAQEQTATALVAETDARAAAEQNFDDALAAVDVLLKRVADARLDSVPRTDRVRCAILNDAVDFYRRFLDRNAHDAQTRFQAASARCVLARVRFGLRDHEQARADAEAGLAEFDAMLAKDPDDPRARRERAKGRDVLGQILDGLGDDRAARAAFDGALDDRRALASLDPPDPLALRALAGQLHNAAYQLSPTEPKRALVLWAEAAAATDRAAAGAADADWVARMTAVQQSAMAGTQLRVGDAAATGVAIDRASAALAHFDLANRMDLDLVEAAVLVERFRGILAYRRQRIDDATAAAHAQIALAERLVHEYPERPSCHTLLANGWQDLAIYLSTVGEDREAVAAIRKAAAVLEEQTRADPADPVAKRSYVMCAGNFAEALLRAGDRDTLAEARQFAARALELLRGDPTMHDWQLLVSSTLEHLVDVESADGHLAAARDLAAELRTTTFAWRDQQPDSVEAQARVIQVLALDAMLAWDARDAVATRAAVAAGSAAIARLDGAVASDQRVGIARAQFALVDGLAAAATADKTAAIAAAARTQAEFAPDDWRSHIGGAEILAAVALQTGDPADLLAAESACRATTAAIAWVADGAEAREARRSATRIDVLLAEFARRRGDAGAAQRFDTAIAAMCAAMTGSHHSVDDEERLLLACSRRGELAVAAGDVAKARELAELLVAQSAAFPAKVAAARLFAGAGARDAALAQLVELAAAAPGELGPLLADPAFASLRDDPAFAALRANAR